MTSLKIFHLFLPMIVTMSAGNSIAFSLTPYSRFQQIPLIESRETLIHSGSKTDDKITSNSKEELLMKISFEVQSGFSDSDAIELIQSYVLTFPFSVVLPVQPLTYSKREEGDGVNLTFLRKKTKEKSAVDGGVQFSVSSSNQLMHLVAVRNSDGQTINKVFSEGLIVKSFVNGLLGEEGGTEGILKEKLLSKMKVKRATHKWMN